MRKHIMLISLMAIALLAPACAPAAAAPTTWNVDTVVELEDAFTDANSGDTIVIAADTYNITQPLDVGDRSLTIIGAGAGLTIIDASGITTSSEFALGRSQGSSGGIDYLVIRDLTVRNAPLSGQSCIMAGNVETLEISGCCTAYSNYSNGFTIKNIRMATFTSCTAHGNNIVGFYLEDIDTATLDSCTAYDNNYQGFFFNKIGTATLDSCTAYDNKYQGFFLDDSALITLDSPCTATFTSCTAYDNEFYGFNINNIKTAIFTSCTAYDNINDGFYLYTLDTATLTSCTSYGSVYGDGFDIEDIPTPDLTFSSICKNDDVLSLEATGTATLTSCAAYDNYVEGFNFDRIDFATLTFCTAHGNVHDGIDMDDVGCAVIDSCTSYCNGTDGIDIDNLSTFVVNSLSYNNGDAGFELGVSVPLETVLLENSISGNPAETGIVLTNCTSYGNDSGLILDGDDLDGMDITNYISSKNNYSIALEEMGGGILPAPAYNISVSYSDFWDLSPGIMGSLLLTGPGIIHADPQFVSPAGSNFRLTDSSPCKDSGTDTSASAYGAVTDDIDGVPRPQGRAYDMGAYEGSPASWWSPASLQPIVITSLAKVTSLWQDMTPYISESADEDIFMMAELVQEYVEHSATVANPVFACGGLAKALSILEEMETILISDI